MALRNQRLVSQNNFSFDLAAVEVAEAEALESTSRGGGRREVGGDGDKQRADLAEETIRDD